MFPQGQYKTIYIARIELFARRAAPGWKVWGNEAPEKQEATT